MVLVTIATSQVIPKYSHICSAREGRGHHTYKCCAQTLVTPMDCSPPGSSVHGIFQAGILGWVATSFSRGSSQPRVRTQVFCGSALQTDSSPAESPGKPSLLQGIFLTQGSNPGLWHCRQILYCLSHQGNQKLK